MAWPRLFAAMVCTGAAHSCGVLLKRVNHRSHLFGIRSILNLLRASLPDYLSGFVYQHVGRYGDVGSFGPAARMDEAELANDFALLVR